MNPNSPINQLYLEIAKNLSPIPEDPNDLKRGIGPYFLLMPSLCASCDAVGDNIHNLKLHQFVLSDDQSLYIPIESCLNNAEASQNIQLKHMVSKDGYKIKAFGLVRPREDEVPDYTVVVFMELGTIYCAVRQKEGGVEYFPVDVTHLTDKACNGIKKVLDSKKPNKQFTAQFDREIFLAITDKGYQQESQDYPELSASETERVVQHSSLTQNYYMRIRALNQMRIGGNSLGAQLRALYYSLMAGGEAAGDRERQAAAKGEESHEDSDALKGGTGENAGVAAIEGATRFVDYWQALPEAAQQAYYKKYSSRSGHGLELTIRRFIRPSPSDAALCVEITAQYIAFLLNEYINEIYQDTGDMQALCEKDERALNEAIESEEYPIAIPRTRIPDMTIHVVLSKALEVSTEQQQAFVKPLHDVVGYVAERMPNTFLDLGNESSPDEIRYITACSHYIDRLTKAYRKHPTVLIDEKRQIVSNALLALLTPHDEKSEHRINNFRQILIAGRDTLSIRRDHLFITFMKALGVIGATIFSLGIGSYSAYQVFFGQSATEGKKLLTAVGVKPTDQAADEDEKLPGNDRQ